MLEAKAEGEGVEKAYSVDIESLQALLETRKGSRKYPGEVRAKSADAEGFADLLRDLTTQVVQSSSEAADLRARLQLTERAQSTLEEEAVSLREERDRLRAELEAERAKGFWRRLFGG